MPQTLLAMLALMLATLLAINQQRMRVETQRAMLDDELEVMATGIALQSMEYIGTKAFDQQTTAANNLFGRLIDDEDELTAHFPTERRCPLLPDDEGRAGYDTCDDINDYNAMQWERVPFVVGADTIAFEVRAEVYYLNDARERTSQRYFNKEVVVTVQQVVEGDEPMLLRRPVQVSRMFSYP